MYYPYIIHIQTILHRMVALPFMRETCLDLGSLGSQPFRHLAGILDCLLQLIPELN